MDPSATRSRSSGPGPNLNASSNQIATEALEIVHGGLQMQAGV